jgi:hypothetical protein
MQLTFGAGDLFATPLTDAYGNAITTQTPIRIAGLQEMSLDFAGDLKEFYGQNKFALAVGQGKVKTTGKLKGAVINGQALSTLFFGLTPTPGTMKAVFADTTGTAVPSTPYTITPLTTYSTLLPATPTFVSDLGVVDQNGRVMVQVASAPATGQYSFSAGVYTFASADVGLKMYISFSYTYTLAGANHIQLLTLPMGYTPQMKLHMMGNFQGKKSLLVLSSVTSTKLMMYATKNDDFSVPEVDFSAQADSSGYSIGDIYTQE